jgi:hypothetical protein
MAIVVFWIIIAIAGAIVAGNKGRSGVGWFFTCLFLSPLAILVLLALPTLKPPEPQPVRLVGAPSEVERRPCPYCAELILPAARVCRFCSRQLPQDWASAVLELTDAVDEDGTVHRLPSRPGKE